MAMCEIIIFFMYLTMANCNIKIIYLTFPFACYRAKKRVEDRLNRIGLRKMGKKRDGSIEENSGGCK